MKLFYVPTSPYARMARVTLRERGLSGRIEEVVVTVRTPENEVLRHNVLGMVPTLLLEDGTALGESSLVCEYLDAWPGEPQLFPRAAPPAWRARELLGFAKGLMDSLALRMRELRRPENERSPRALAYEAERAQRAYAALEARATVLDGVLDIGHIALGCTLAFADHRLPVDDWRRDRPALAAWYDRIAARIAMKETAPPV